MRDYESEFIEVLRSAGFDVTNGIIADGEKHRCDAIGKPKKKDCTYVFYSDNPPNGGYQNWTDGQGWQEWWPPGVEKKITNELRARIANTKRLREKDKNERENKALFLAYEEYKQAGEVDPEYPYLVRKKIGTIGLVQDSKSIMLPLYRFVGDKEKVEFASYQRIYPDGNKLYPEDISTKGIWGILGELNTQQTVYVAEGYATAATIYEAIDRENTVIIALSATNIDNVVKVFTSIYPLIDIIICSDNDESNKNGNIGLIAAKKVAETYKLSYCLPCINGDFNDLYVLDDNYDRVKDCLLDITSFASKLTPKEGTIEWVNAIDLKIKPYEWLWENRLLLGGINMLAGQPGTGKSTITTDFAARVTANLPWPDGTTASVSGVAAILSAEDDPARTIVPRFLAHGGDRNKLGFMSSVVERECTRTVNLQRDVPKFIEMCKARGPKLIIIDPVASYLSGVDTHRDADVRSALEPLARFVMENQICMLLVSHFNKISRDSKQTPLERISGSGAFGALARIVWIAAKEEMELNDEDFSKPREYKFRNNMFLIGKCNQTIEPSGFYYDIESYQVSELVNVSKIAWKDQIYGSASEVLWRKRDSKMENKKLDEAKEWLLVLLSNGAALSSEILEQGKEKGFYKNLLWKAKSEIGALARKRQSFEDRDSRWEWYLDEYESDESNDYND